MEHSAEIDNSEVDGSFEFETDHLALRGNKDYCDLLKYLIKLEAQKVNAIQDLEELADQKRKALEEPLKFVKNLQNGDIIFPQRQNIQEIPQIDWQKYGIDDVMEMKSTKPNHDVNSDDDGLVRGRKITISKPYTFNKLWSCEEQLRLEELLEIYPEEGTEANRYKKIAQALGTRTPIQVMSRVQKYFAKLAKAGLPIPGRRPKKMKDKNKMNVLYKKSTFFPQLHVPVRMDDVQSDLHKSNEVPYESHSSSKYYIELLKQAKEQRILDENFPIKQENTMCVGCQKTEFIGARWTDHAGTDYCTDCVVSLLPEEKLTPVR